jgi:protein-S-isoprenylcysteine O-methyltransferase Ste14
LTVYGYFDLGIENTYGSRDGLITSGLYRYSRNPQYAASILGFLGLSIAAASADVAALLRDGDQRLLLAAASGRTLAGTDIWGELSAL